MIYIKKSIYNNFTFGDKIFNLPDSYHSTTTSLRAFASCLSSVHMNSWKTWPQPGIMSAACSSTAAAEMPGNNADCRPFEISKWKALLSLLPVFTYIIMCVSSFSFSMTNALMAASVVSKFLLAFVFPVARRNWVLAYRCCNALVADRFLISSKMTGILASSMGSYFGSVKYLK